MRWDEIDRSQEPIQLFQSDFLERFTHVHPAAVLATWGPVVAYFIGRSFVTRPAGSLPLSIPLGLLAGLWVWTFVEYAGHRFVLHFRPRSDWQERLLFLLHGVHHVQPHIKTRLVLPPTLTLPLGALFYGGFYLVLGAGLSAPHWVAPVFGGFAAGYLSYDMLHYATHHYPMRRGVLKYLKRYHLQHHYKTPQARFGVTSPLWDRVFDTKPA